MKTGKGGAGMIGGVRSPMATAGHGIVSKKPNMYPPGCHNATSSKKMSGNTSIKTPYGKKNIA